MFTVYSNYEDKRSVVCLKLVLKKTFFRDRVIFALKTDFVSPISLREIVEFV